jgi:small redox-active disulfide protein 2
MGLLDKLFKGSSTFSQDTGDHNTEVSPVTGSSDGGSSCGCDCEESGSSTQQSTSNNNGLTIKILGSGCKNCITLTENVKVAIDEMKIVAQIEKVTDLNEITGYGIMSTPALVLNEKVISYGKVLKPKEVIKILEKVLGE